MRLSLALLVAALAALTTGTALAQRPNQWTTDCAVDRLSDKQKCRVVIYVLEATARPEALLDLHYADGTFALIGTRYAGSARIRIDGNPAIAFSGCDRSTCVLLAKDSAVLLQQMLKGQRALVEFVNIHGESLGPREVSLAGFGAAYKELIARR